MPCPTAANSRWKPPTSRLNQESVGRYPELKPGDYVMLAITDTGTGMSDEGQGARVRAVFHHQGRRPGNRSGIVHLLRHHQTKRRPHQRLQRAGPGHDLQDLSAAGGIAGEDCPSARLDAPDLPRGTETILLVEDDPALREMAATLLRRLGYTVLTAANGIEALSLKQQRDTGHIDLLFTDVVMPHMSGKELADRVRALYPHTRILFTSAYTENAIVHQGVLDKGVALLQKPFTPSALAHKVREVLDHPSVPASGTR